MTDLKVDYDVLDASTQTLETLKSDFDNIERRRDTTDGYWGHDDVTDAMDEFASNMDHHRKDLSKEISEVHKKLEATVKTFREADQKLKDELEKNISADEPDGQR
jgi:phage-related tail protein